jgi:NAD(P)-dependent dehydrogenase (short-subunit alcohol dehydrogenase family)
MNIAGKVAVITGGRGGLGAEMARALASAGAKVAILGRDLAKAEKVAADMSNADGSIIAVEADVLDRTSLEAAKEQVSKQLGSVDILVNAAGGNSPDATTSDEKSFFDIPADGIEKVMNLNFTGTFLSCQVFGSDMTESGEGVIVNISSMCADRPLTRVGVYSAAKAAIDNFTKWLAVHMSQNYSKNIRVNAIAPGFFLTEQNRFLLTDEKSGELTARGETIIEHTPMGRFGEPAELVGIVTWLLSNEAKFVTGTVIPVDGGFSAFSGV